MVLFSSAALLATLNVFLGFTAAAPFSTDGFIAQDANSTGPGSSTYWVSDIKRQGAVAFGGNSSFQIFRSVKDFGAKGDGSTDDTAAINLAISSGNRCGLGCDSSTVTPALVYFPPGTYMVSKPIIQYYYTQFVGDAVDMPTLKASASFAGMAVIDADPYEDSGANWFTNQNNFFRQVRNFVIDLTAMPPSSGAGIHWQVAQATSLQNIRFEMVKGGADNKQQGIFMDNGSGGFMTDLTFNGGNYGAFLGNQQYTTRNLTFNDCNTAIFMNWNWAWTFKSVSINNCQVGIDMANSPSNQTVGSVLLMDSKITNTPIGVNTSFTQNSIPTTGGTLIIDNVDFSGAQTAVLSAGTAALAGGSLVPNWVQGRSYTGNTGSRVQAPAKSAATKPQSLIATSGGLVSGAIFERAKPQYETYPSSSFVSVKDQGAKGDGQTDDTAAIQKAMDSVANTNNILYFDHGAYLVSDTVKVPKNIKITGEIWPLIMATGKAFSDEANPKPMFQVGQAGDTGGVEMSDLIMTTAGPAPGAVLMEWNSAGDQGANGLWDVHFRVGGFAGTQLQSDTCAKNPNATHEADTKCAGAGLLFHATTTSSVYVENCWYWVADHELDLSDHGQIDIYNGRGVLIESQGPMWLSGTSSEHSVFYNYQLNNAQNIYMGMIQSETPYYQNNPTAPAGFKTVQTAWGDPQSMFTGNASLLDPTGSTPDGTQKAWGLRVIGSKNALVYGAGLYSFFDDYGQDCLQTESCQANMVAVDSNSTNINLFGLSTKASTNMVTDANTMAPLVLGEENESNFCQTIGLFSPT